jgi:hypothetical protein
MTYNKQKNPVMRLGNPQIDPMTGQPMQTTMVPPQMAPMGGGFTPQVQQNIQGMTGSSEMRQYAAGGLNAPLFMSSPLNGNAFTAALQSAKASGASTFEVGGKTYNVK